MKSSYLILLCTNLLLMGTLNFEQNQMPSSKIWHFDTLNEWTDASQKTDGKRHYKLLNNALLQLYTNPNTEERSKIKSSDKFNLGSFTWRLYVSELGKGDNCSIGAFLFHDDQHELDFEIGYGTKTVRKELKAKEDEVVVYMSSQGFPSVCKKILLKRAQWYEVTIELKKGKNNTTVAYWKINHTLKFKTQLQYGESIYYRLYCSMENLSFMGDHLPKKLNYALFDYVKFDKPTE